MKARLKTIIISTLSTFIAFTVVTFNSCTSDKCKSINCAYGGVCKDGACLCQTGYEGPECETFTASKYVGSWSVQEKGTLAQNPDYYTVKISHNSNDAINQVEIDNFYNSLTSSVSAYVVGDTINIPQQTVNGDKVQGHGYLSNEGSHYNQNGQIVLYYSVTLPDGTVDDFGLSSGTPSLWQH